MNPAETQTPPAAAAASQQTPAIENRPGTPQSQDNGKLGSQNGEELGGIRRFINRHMRSQSQAPAAGASPAKKKEDEAQANEQGGGKPKADAPAAAATPPAKRQPQSKPGRKPTFRPKPVETPPPAAPTAEEIAEAVARGTTEAMEQQQRRQEAAAKPKAPELSRQEAYRRSVFDRMEKMFPDDYRGLRKRYEDAYQKLAEYSKKWESEHPGEKFNEDDEEHAEFMDSIDVDYHDLDFSRAEAAIQADERTAELTKPLQDRLAGLDQQEELRQFQGEINQRQISAAMTFWDSLGDDYKGLVSADGKFDEKRFAELGKTNPDTFEIIVASASQLREEAAALSTIMRFPNMNNPAKNPLHAELNRFVYDSELALASRPPNERLNQVGQLFLPSAQYYKVPRTERQKYWTFSTEDLLALRASNVAAVANAKSIAEEQKFMEKAKRRGLSLPGAPGTTPTPPKPESPSMGGEPRMAAAPSDSGNSSGGPGSGWLSKFQGRK